MIIEYLIGGKVIPRKLIKISLLHRKQLLSAGHFSDYLTYIASNPHHYPAKQVFLVSFPQIRLIKIILLVIIYARIWSEGCLI